MKTIGLTLAGAVAGLGLLASIASATPSITRTTMPQSTVEQVADGCGYGRHRERRCSGYGYDRKCWHVCVRNGY